MTEPKTKEKPELIYQKIPAIMADISAIGKKRQNVAQKYKFRGIDDVYNEIHSILAAHKVFTIPEVTRERHEERRSKADNVLIYRILTVKYSFYAEDGSHVEAVVVGEGMDSGDKAGNKALSAAHKYALLQVFCIPTEDPKDSENENHQITGDPRAIQEVESKQDRASQELADMADQPESGITYPKDITLVKTDGKEIKVDQFGALAKFKSIKEAIGTKPYYEILGTAGYEKSNQVPKKDIPKIYAKMVDAYMGT